MSSTAHFKPFRLGIKTRHTLQGALVRVLLTVCFQASAMRATAQEVPGQPEAVQVRMPAVALDLPQLRASAVEYLIEGRARALSNALMTPLSRWSPLEAPPTYRGWRFKRGRVAYSVTPLAFVVRAEY
jgi:hypothetical protein